MEKLELIGNSSDNYYFNEEENYKVIWVFTDIDGADVALELTSVDKSNKHSELSKFLDKKIKISIETINE